jgi:hypothetical protein
MERENVHPNIKVRYIPSGTGISMPEGSTPEDYRAAINAFLRAADLMDEALAVVHPDSEQN